MDTNKRQFQCIRSCLPTDIRFEQNLMSICIINYCPSLVNPLDIKCLMFPEPKATSSNVLSGLTNNPKPKDKRPIDANRQKKN